jgi:uncharacterized membrane protein YfcA
MTVFGITAFPDIGPLAIAILALIYFGAAFLRGLLGFGSGAPSVLFGAFILPPHEAVILSVVVAMFAQLLLLPDGFRHGNFKIALPIMAGFFLASIFGVWVFATMRAEWLTLVLGLLLTLATLGDLTDAITRFAKKLDLTRRGVPFGLGAFTGFLGSIGGAGIGYFLSVYVRWASETPAIFRGTNILTSALTSLWRLGMFAIFGLMAWHYLIELAVLAPTVLLGNWLGARASGTLSADRYFRIFQLVLLMGALILTFKGIRNLM